MLGKESFKNLFVYYSLYFTLLSRFWDLRFSWMLILLLFIGQEGLLISNVFTFDESVLSYWFLEMSPYDKNSSSFSFVTLVFLNGEVGWVNWPGPEKLLHLTMFTCFDCSGDCTISFCKMFKAWFLKGLLNPMFLGALLVLYSYFLRWLTSWLFNSVSKNDWIVMFSSFISVGHLCSNSFSFYFL